MADAGSSDDRAERARKRAKLISKQAPTVNRRQDTDPSQQPTDTIGNCTLARAVECNTNEPIAPEVTQRTERHTIGY